MTGGRRPRAASGNWPSLPEAGWPRQHRAAWDAALQPGKRLRKAGPAALLASATCDLMGQLYGQFLYWLQANGNLEPDGVPAAQMTKDLLGQFIAARRKTVSDNTVYNNLRMLAMMMKCLAPDHDWKWIWRHKAGPRRREARAARHPACMFPAGLLMHRLITAMQEAMATPLDQLPLDRMRDCLIVAIAINSGLRPRNNAAMRIEENLIRRTTGWEILFEEDEVKNGHAILHPVPAVLNPFIERYLSVDRPRRLTPFMSGTDAMWLSRKGGQLSTGGCALVFARIGQEMLGYPINPNSVRHVLATRILDNNPRDLTTAALALAHNDLGTVSMFYDQSGGKAAQTAWLQLLDELRAGNQP